MQFSIEDLPAPFGPMMARISPRAMSKETSVSAFTPPNARLTFSTASRVSGKARTRLMLSSLGAARGGGPQGRRGHESSGRPRALRALRGHLPKRGLGRSGGVGAEVAEGDVALQGALAAVLEGHL